MTKVQAQPHSVDNELIPQARNSNLLIPATISINSHFKPLHYLLDWSPHFLFVQYTLRMVA